MRHFIQILCLLLLPFHSFSQAEYKVFIDLNDVVDDQLEVTVLVPKIEEEEIEFQFPKIVPGTYSIYDFGRFISGFRAYDSNGSLLEVEDLTTNRKLIKQADQLHKITYWVEDTYDTTKPNLVFEPAGTNIEEGENYILNTYGFVGYLKGYQALPYSLEIKHQEQLFGASGLNKSFNSDSLDIFKAPDYYSLADGPIMYCAPDTTSFEIGNAKILVSVYSPNKISKSDLVGGYIKETLEAQEKYLNGQLPVDRYAFLIYHFSGAYSSSLSFGALEHSYSSLYSLPELHPILIAQTLKDFVAHEFFHVITPLNIHSEEIAEFDFIEPKMSKHLWMYEGVTEYAAGLAQVKYGHMDIEQYIEVLLKKISGAELYDDKLAFTELSEKCLDIYQSQYSNVYQKGALIGLCLDLTLRNISMGEYGIQHLMNDLSNKFGPTTAFEDDELFDIITDLTYSEIREFFSMYVEGGTPLPLENLLKMVGLTYTPKSIKKEPTLGNINFKTNELNNQLIITNTSKLNVFGEEIGYKTGDIIAEFDGMKVDAFNFENVFESFKNNRKSGNKIDVWVQRENAKGNLKKIKLSGHVMEVNTYTSIDLKLNPEANLNQLKLRKSWIAK